jgi:hypothetical protein
MVDGLVPPGSCPRIAEVWDAVCRGVLVTLPSEMASHIYKLGQDISHLGSEVSS